MKIHVACHRPLLAAVAVLLAVLLVAPATFAQGKKKKISAPAAATSDSKTESGAGAGTGDAEKDQPKVKIERGAGGKKVYKIEGEIVIEGKIQKPEAFYVLQKSGINYDWHELKQEFVPKILDSVTKAPF
jgi:hypothetical protein